MAMTQVPWIRSRTLYRGYILCDGYIHVRLVRRRTQRSIVVLAVVIIPTLRVYGHLVRFACKTSADESTCQ